MSETFIRGKEIHSRFSYKRQKDLEWIARDVVRKFAYFIGCRLEVNDRNQRGEIDYSMSDFCLYVPEIGKIDLEAETKATRHWGYIKDGIDIPVRKLKYIKDEKRYLHFMVKEDQQQLVIIPGTSIISAPKINKGARQPSGAKEYETFLRISLNKCIRYRVTESEFVLWS